MKQTLFFPFVATLFLIPVSIRGMPTPEQNAESIAELLRAMEELRKTVESQQHTIRALEARLYSPSAEISREPDMTDDILPEELSAEVEMALMAEEDDIMGRAPFRLPMPQILQGLNPDISAIGDVVYDLSDNSNPLNRAVSGGGDRLTLREFELGFSSVIDPYVKGAAYIGFHGDHVHVEEAYAQSLSLPLGLQVKGGRFFADFGKLNKVHTHDLPQVDRPLVLTRFFGDENLKGDGLGVSWLVPNPWEQYINLTFNVFDNFSRGHEHGEEHEDAHTDGEESEMVQHLTHYSDLMYLARASTYLDITDNSNVEIGMSGITVDDEAEYQTFIEGMDITYRWKPLREALYQSLLLRSEILLGQAETPNAYTRPWGMYAYGEYQFARGISSGLRFDYTDIFDADANNEYAVGPYLTWWLSEFFRMRLQYQHITSDILPHEDRIYLQGTFIMGSHGAHAF